MDRTSRDRKLVGAGPRHTPANGCSPTLRCLVETTPKKVFVSGLDWPGLSRGGKDESLAVEALLAAAPRYAAVARKAGFAFDDVVTVEAVEHAEGNATTAFGAPAIIAEADRRPTDDAEAARLGALVRAAWAEFDEIAASAPEELRKGPRGGGRDRTKIVGHVTDAEAAYAGQIGIKLGSGASQDAIRAAITEVLEAPSDGTPLAGRKWTQRYAARRVAWHVLDHAWEIEDRTEPGRPPGLR